MSLLPINAIHSDFCSLICHKNLVVKSETGSGKSTHLPLWAAEYGRVLVIEPRRIACTALAEYLAEQRKEKVGDSIGYAIKLDSQYSDQSQVIFVTPGVALKWFMEDKLAHFDIVMIDEFHERRWDSDLLLSLLNTHNKHRLLLTSATMESERLAQYIDGVVLKAEGRQYPVSFSFLATQSQLMPSGKDLESRIVSTLQEALLNGQEGDVLIFLPGKKEITQCVQMASSLFPELDMIPLYAGVSDELRQRALSQSKKQRVIFSTNVAETSLTIPNITLVIDSGLERRTHQRNGRTALALHSISKASADQRAGRAGRTQAGHAIRLYGQHAPLELMTPPELQREELVEPVLAAASCGSVLCELSFLEPLPEKALGLAETKLQTMLALDDNKAITEYGLRLFPLPIDTLFAHLISIIEGKAEKETVVDLVSALSASQKLYSFEKSEMALDSFLRWNPKRCDVVTLVSLLRGHDCAGLVINEEVLKEAKALSEQIRHELELPSLEVSSRLKRESVLAQIVHKLPELVYVRRKKRREAFGNGYQEVVLGRESVFSQTEEAAIVFDQFSLPGRGSKQVMTIATVLTPIDMVLLIDGGLAEIQMGELVSHGDILQVERHHYYANRLIHTDYCEPENEASIPAIVGQVKKGQLFPGFRHDIETKIAAWTLYCQLNGNRKANELTFESWFTEQLGELGITSLDEMALFDESDFVFNGIPEWEWDEFISKYPQQVLLPELALTVEYFTFSKRLVLHYKMGGRKGELKRWELPSWTGWKIQYKKASRVIDIK